MVLMVFMVFWGFKVPKQTVAWLGDGIAYGFNGFYVVLGRMVEHSNIRSLSNFQQMFCFTKPS